MKTPRTIAAILLLQALAFPAIIYVPDNFATGGNGGGGGGVYLWVSEALICDNIICNNEAKTGGGIGCDYGHVLIAHNHIHHNSAIYGGGISHANGAPEIRSNLIDQNSVVWTGGGIACNNKVRGVIRDNISLPTRWQGPCIFGGTRRAGTRD